MKRLHILKLLQYFTWGRSSIQIRDNFRDIRHPLEVQSEPPGVSARRYSFPAQRIAALLAEPSGRSRTTRFANFHCPESSRSPFPLVPLPENTRPSENTKWSS